MTKLASVLLLVAAPLAASAATPLLYSRSAVVYDVGQRQVLLERNPDEVAPVASLTKLMTAMIVLDQAPVLEETLTIDSADLDQLKHSGSRLPVGATLEREEMLRLTLMSSENRAASALSRAFPGGRPAFIPAMNDKARALDMAHTHFEDPTGLSPQNVSTARDVVKMADAASRYPLIAAFTTLSHYGEEVGKRTVFYRNTDPMVDQPGWDIQLSKTGFTDEAGRCIVIEASMPNGPVIIALLGAASSRARSADLVSIRRWLEGNETPVTAPRVHYAGMSRHHHKTMVGAHESTMRLVAYPAGSAFRAHRPSGRHKTGKTHHRNLRGV
jgi:serine-type D-Ala-D-Ala endopeptidase (penicillin-binding protein 7)